MKSPIKSPKKSPKKYVFRGDEDIFFDDVTMNPIEKFGDLIRDDEKVYRLISELFLGPSEYLDRINEPALFDALIR